MELQLQLSAGAIKTNFAKNTGKKDTKIAMPASKVTYTAYKCLMKNKKVIIPGIRNKLFMMLSSSIVMRLIGTYRNKII